MSIIVAFGEEHLGDLFWFPTENKITSPRS